MRKKARWIIFIGVFLLSFPLLSFSQNTQDKNDELYKNLDVFSEALSFIQTKYVEDKDAKDLIYGALKGLLQSLDAYSQFLDPDAYKELLVETEGQFGGLGIEITIKEGLLTVVSPIEDTPAWNAGVKAGDIIVKIEDELTKGITLNEAVKKLRGKPGTKVKITVLREKDHKLEEITITRDIIKIKDIKRAELIDDRIGYVRLTEFRESTSKDLQKALADLSKKGMKALVLDLRNNPGGLLNSAIEIASLFLPTKELVVSIKSRQGDEIKYKALNSSSKYLDIPMVVMINQGSASASEIVAAALRDHKRAILLGETSFGKGSVQTVLPLSDGSALRLTTAKYYTPKGISIHEKGINPDITVEPLDVDTEKKEEKVFRELEKPKEFNYRDDYQILRAVDLLRGLLVLQKDDNKEG